MTSRLSSNFLVEKVAEDPLQVVENPAAEQKYLSLDGDWCQTNISRHLMANDTKNSTFNSSYEEMYARLPASDCIPWLVLLITECLAIVILNIITIIVFVKQRQLHRRGTYLIIHLAIVDLLVGAVSGPLQIENYMIYCDLWVKEAIQIRLHPNNINRDSGIEIPEAWMPTIKKHNTRRTERQRTPERTTAHRNSEDRNAPITAVENQLITAQQRALKG
ncbi:hypothetical protein ACROYT_G017388 [Oculina patagonica]